MKLGHKHHIIPRHMGGTDDPHNVTEPMMIFDHAIAHLVLYRRFGKWEDKFVWQCLSGQYEKEEILSEKMRLRMTGTKMTDEVKQKKSDSLTRCWAEGRFQRTMPDKWPAKRRKIFGEGKEWESMSEAARELGVANASTIQYRCKNNIGDWRYL